MADVPDESARRSELAGQETEPATTRDVDQHRGAAIKNLRLNYAYFDPSEGTPPPLPLSIPRALLNAPTADLRSILRERLEAEEITIRLREIRFWRMRQPLQIARALDDRNVWTQEEGAEKKYEAIPFTESLFSSLGELIWDEKLLHLIVTGGEAPFILEPAVPGPSILTMQALQTIAMGTYSMGYSAPEPRSFRDVREGDRHSQDIHLIKTLSPPSHSPGSLPTFGAGTPTILLGINNLDVGCHHSDEIRLISYVSDIHPDGFKVHFDTFGGTMLYSGRLSWMALTPHHTHSGDAIQCGTADSQSYQYPRKVGRRYTKERVLFRRAYDRAPIIFSCLAGFGVGGSASTHWDIRTFVTNIDREGFTLHIEKARDSERDVDQMIASAQASWVAFPTGGIAGMKMACGEFHMGEGKMGKEEGNYRHIRIRGHSTFTETFTSAPKVFAALKSLDVDKSTTIRLELNIENVTREGMDWTIATWSGTIVYSATFAYLAVEES
ncbi:hypothetical protein BKA70DRAFT_1401634 [Coprinopsis sp. MPI-PUGE-AT-0042]|nr:hypothetical protein BKA70DRAFT_1401634 [Coprinopsis sp. MPI-PUGE-AT-0042]